MPDITPLSKKSSTKFFNWGRYFRDMYVSAVRAGTGAFMAFAGSNTAEAMAPGALQGVGLNWQQALVAAASALIFDVVRYINLKPIPEEVSAAPFNPPNQ